MTSVELVEGETLEQKIERIVSNKEPIKDGAPEIFTERKEGVISAYNIRTDRWEIATEAMDLVSRNIEAKRDGKIKTKPQEDKKEETKVIEIKKDDGIESTQGQESQNKASNIQKVRVCSYIPRQNTRLFNK